MKRLHKQTCSKCSGPLEPNRIGRHAYCKKCFAEYCRKNRKRHSELTETQRRKVIARSYANVYLKRGKIKKSPCRKCGSPESQMHHDDYDKPLEIDWLCRPCHLKLHNEH